MRVELSECQLAAVVDAVTAVVTRDVSRLSRILGGPSALSRWMNRSVYNEVELVAPPGPPEDWALDATDIGTDPHRVHVVVPLWRRGARSARAYLEILLIETGADRWRPTIHDLYLDT